MQHSEILKQVQQLTRELTTVPSVKPPSVWRIFFLSGLQQKIIHQFFYHCKETVNIYNARKRNYIVNNIYLDVNSNQISTNVYDISLQKNYSCGIHLLVKSESELSVSKYTDLVCPFCKCLSCGTTVK